MGYNECKCDSCGKTYELTCECKCDSCGKIYKLTWWYRDKILCTECKWFFRFYLNKMEW